MALGDSYATLTDLKARLDIADTDDDDRLTAALAVASREIETYCDRQFNDAGSASARTFEPLTAYRLLVDDFSTTTGLVIATDTDDDGAYDTTWTSSDYDLEPAAGQTLGQSAWPYSRIHAVGDYTYPRCGRRRRTVQVTARWGWSAVPSGVAEACLIAAAELFKAGDAPFGIAGYGEFGPVRLRMNSRAMQLLAPYRRNPVLVA